MQVSAVTSFGIITKSIILIITLKFLLLTPTSPSQKNIYSNYLLYIRFSIPESISIPKIEAICLYNIKKYFYKHIHIIVNPIHSSLRLEFKINWFLVKHVTTVIFISFTDMPKFYQCWNHKM